MTHDSLDDRITRALAEEDRALLARHAEPGYLRQATGLFRGRLGWVAGVAYVTAVLAFAASALALWNCWHAPGALEAVRWGASAAIAFQLSALCKGFLGQQLEANRVLRELKRVELQVALARAGGAG
jgi:hypothetical protein